MVQRASEGRRYGVTKHEDYLEQCFITLGLSCKRRQVFCFICTNMWTNNTNEYPNSCANCGTTYYEKNMFMMPDIVIEDPERHGKGVIFIQGSHHDKEKVKIKDKFQIDCLKENNWRTFVVYNEELDYLRHANRCFLALGIYRAMRDKTMYDRAFKDERELPK